MVVDLEVEHHVIMDMVVEEVSVEEEIVHHHLENDQDRGKNSEPTRSAVSISSVPLKKEVIFLILDHHQKELVRHPVTMHTQADIKLPFHCSKSQIHFCPIYK